MLPTVARYVAMDRMYLADTCDPLRRAAVRKELRFSALVHGAYPGKRMPDTMLPEVRTVGYWDAANDQNWGLDWHRNEGIEFTFLERGKLAFQTEASAHNLRSGDFCITRPWQTHALGNPDVEASRLHFLILDVGVRRPNESWTWPAWMSLADRDRDYLTQVLSQNAQPVWKASEEMIYAMQQLSKAVDEHEDAMAESKLRLGISGLLTSVCDLFRKEAPTLDPRLLSSLRVVELFLLDLDKHIQETWTVDSMAASCGLGKTRFTELCKLSMNILPAEYLRTRRLIKAAELLRAEPRMSVVDVATSVGLSSSQHLATLFRQRFGRTPGEYREMAGAMRAD